MKLLDLVFARATARAEMKNLLDTAVAEHRALTLTEALRFDALSIRCEEVSLNLEARALQQSAVSEFLRTKGDLL